ncbi:phytanoyl-CoA dioxygenase [Microbulbifer sp. SH-1]|uniref:phytanoyl-CoA dioxygenase family protein n=1 Tax=Microbulbifer sp. SH-1 TaxID=2681547 RepID=UPI001407B49D|nr:phytanoyl-CoA dioxygenase family protein [Microbulbifer sp. SH-1]QIL89857.1 phytanoyl-CoA dioxygenase [Microbulbifer sp. SH-1]
MILNEQQIAEFHREGYLILNFKFKDDLLDRVISGVERLYDHSCAAGQYPHGTRVQDAWRFDAGVRAIALDKRVLTSLRQLFGRKPRPFQTLNFPVGTEQKTHSDTIHFNSKPSGFMAGAWVALEDVDESNGALTYYPGSHKLPEITMQDVGVPPSYAHYPEYERYIQSLVEQKGLLTQRGILKKGQVLIWHANLLHGGGSHPDKARTRHSQVTHYYFDGCRYFTPMQSTDVEIRWRKPRWIRRYSFFRNPAKK